MVASPVAVVAEAQGPGGGELIPKDLVLLLKLRDLLLHLQDPRLEIDHFFLDVDPARALDRTQEVPRRLK
jgi:hypothetical protein